MHVFAEAFKFISNGNFFEKRLVFAVLACGPYPKKGWTPCRKLLEMNASSDCGGLNSEAKDNKAKKLPICRPTSTKLIINLSNN